MAGRGVGRGRSRGVLDTATTPGGLVSKAEEDEPNAENNHTEKVVKPTDEPNHLAPSDGAGDNSGLPTLSLTDIKSILEDSRTYNDNNDVKHVLICARHFVRSEADVKTLASVIYNKCLEDSTLAKRGSEICDGLTSIEIGNTKFRNCLLSLVQSDYKDKNEMIAQNPARFSGFLAFLCEIFAIMRTASNEVFKPLINPIFDCLNLVLGPQEAVDGDADDDPIKGVSDFVVDDDICETFGSQLLSVGRLLDENADDQMKELINRIRTCIIISKSSARVRCSLLEVMEAYIRGWETANNDTTKFYCDVAVGIISGLIL
uniref:MIF4G domain-containing protein n=1 Tax=Arion vulgaris TaxID=1028688 RepID=A0A0B7A550_9EUPU